MGDRIVIRRCSGGVPSTEFPHPGEPFLDIQNFRFGIAMGEAQPRWYPAIDPDGNLYVDNIAFLTNSGSGWSFDTAGNYLMNVKGSPFMYANENGITYYRTVNITGFLTATKGAFSQGLTSTGTIDNYGETVLRGPVTITGPLNLSLSEFAQSVLPQSYNVGDVLTAGVGPGGAHAWKAPDFSLQNSTLAASLLGAGGQTPGYNVDVTAGTFSVIREGYPTRGTAAPTLDELVAVTTNASFKRSSTGGSFDTAGNYKEYGVDKSRVDFDLATSEKSLLVEGATANSVVNSGVLNGAQLGTLTGVNPGGSLPNGWVLSNYPAGTVATVLAIENYRGMPSIVIKFQASNGTGETVYPALYFLRSNTQPSANGTSWVSSVFFRIESATQAPADIFLATAIVDGTANTNIASTVKSSATLVNATELTRFTTGPSVSPKNDSYVNSLLNWPITSGQTQNFTMRICLPIVEPGPKATSPFLNNSRGAEVITLPATNDVFRANEGTVFMHLKPLILSTTRYFAFPVIWRATNSPTSPNGDNIIQLTQSPDFHLYYQVFRGAVQIVNLDLGLMQEDVEFKVAITYKRNNFSGIMSGNQLQLDTTGEIPPVQTQYIGSDGFVAFFPHKLYSFRTYRRKLSDSDITNLVI